MARKTTKPRLAATDSLSNLAASLGGGKDKAASDAFFVADLPRDQIEAMYRGDWLARKIVDIVPYDSIREWREWSGDRTDVAAIERAERRLGLRSAVQRAMILGRLYGGGAILLGTGEEDAASLARPLLPEAVEPGALRVLHVVSRWQLGAASVIRDPLDPHYGEPEAYTLAGALRGELLLHPSRVVRFFGNPLPDPALAGAQLWSDSVLQTLYDAIHAVALTAAGTTSLVHEAKVDIVTVPNLSEHLSNAATTAQLSARFSYAAAMKSINNLLLLGDGESWARQRIDFSGLPEMVRTFLQMAAGAADIPVTRLLGQSPAGLSATGDSDTRNYYDMISARQELDLRPKLERLDAVLLRSAGVDPDRVHFTFRPLWQLNGLEQAQVALQKAQATQVYASLNLWPAGVTADLVRGQLLEDGTYPTAGAVFAADTAGEAGPKWAQSEIADYSPDQPRDDGGRRTAGGGEAAGQARPENKVAATATSGSSSVSTLVARGGQGWTLSTGISGILGLLNPISPASAQEIDPEEENRGLAEELTDPTAEIRIERYNDAMRALRATDPANPQLVTLTPPGYVPSAQDVDTVISAAEAASIKRVKDYVMPNGQPIGQRGDKFEIRVIPGGGLTEAQKAFDYLRTGGKVIANSAYNGTLVQLPGNAGFLGIRPVSSTPGSLSIDINFPSLPCTKLHF